MPLYQLKYKRIKQDINWLDEYYKLHVCLALWQIIFGEGIHLTLTGLDCSGLKTINFLKAST